MKTFGSQEEKDAAIDSFGDITNENEKDFDEIMSAEIVENTEGEAAETTAQPDDTQIAEDTITTEDSQTKEVEEEKSADTEGTQTEADQTASEPKTFTITEDDLGKYKSPGALLKAMQEKDALIERQGKKIQENIDKINEFNQKIKSFEESKQQTVKTDEVDFDAENEKMLELAEKYQKALKEDPYSEDTSNALWEFNNTMFQNQQKLAKVLKSYKETFEKEKQDIKLKTEMKAAEDREYKEIEEFAKRYKDDFGLNIDPRDAEKEYYNWGESVGKIYYGRQPVNWNEIIIALEALSLESPTLTQNCELAGISTVPPSKDIENYGKLSELINFRDGFRRNPDGTIYRIQRYDPETGKQVPDKFPSLEAAWEYRRVREGYYKKEADEAFNKGIKEAQKVSEQRDTNVLSNDSDQHAGGERTVEQIAQDIENLDMKDPQYLGKLDALMEENKKYFSKNTQGSVKSLMR